MSEETAAASPTQDLKIPALVTMLEAGVHFGHERSKKHPRMEDHIFIQRNRVAIINLEHTHSFLQKAADAAFAITKNPTKDILFVGTKRQARKIVRYYAEAVGMPYVTRRWLGGTFTNFSTILKSIEKLDELKSITETPSLVEKLTKKERLVMQKEISRLELVLEGIMKLRALPAALFVVGAHDEKLAVREANRVGLPVIGLTDTNADPTLVQYPIPANDDAVRSLDLIVGTIAGAIAQARGIELAPNPNLVAVMPSQVEVVAEPALVPKP